MGRYPDLLVSWLALLNAARLTSKERMEAELLFAAKIGYLGTTMTNERMALYARVSTLQTQDPEI